MEYEYNSKFKTVLKLFLVIAVIAAAFFTYRFFTSPKTIVLSTIKNASGSFTELLNKLETSQDLPENFTFNADAKFNIKIGDTYRVDGMEQFEDLVNGLTININGKYLSNNYTDLNFKLNTEETEILNILGVSQNNKIYIKFIDALDKYIEISEMEESNNETYIDELNTINKTIVKEISNELDSKYFKKTSTTITLNNKEEKVTKNSLTMTNEETKTIIKNIIKNLKENDEFLSAFSKVSGQTKDELITSMDEIINDESETINEKIEYNVYTQGISNKVVFSEFVVITDEGEIKITFEENNGLNVIKFINNAEEEMFNSDFTVEFKTTENEIDATIYTVTSKISLNIKNIDNNYKISVTIFGSEDDTVANLESVKYNEIMTLTSDINTKYEETTNMDMITVTDSIKSEELTDEDTMTLLFYYLEKLDGTALGDIINSLMMMELE